MHSTCGSLADGRMSPSVMSLQYFIKNLAWDEMDEDGVGKGKTPRRKELVFPLSLVTDQTGCRGKYKS